MPDVPATDEPATDEPATDVPATDVLVTVAHPDDETFGCGSILAHAARSGARTHVLCATRGELGERHGDPADTRPLGVIREEELRAAAALLGVTSVELGSWIDSEMQGDPAPDSFMAAPVDDVVAFVTDAIERVRPDVVITLDASDGHRDHAHMRDATLLACERVPHPPTRVYLQCLPRILVERWAEILRAQDPDAPHLDATQIGTPESDITTVIDTSALLELRDRAMALHASQVAPFEIMPPDLRREFLATDRLRRITPPWTGDPLEHDIFG